MDGCTVNGALAKNRKHLECLTTRADLLSIQPTKYTLTSTLSGIHHYTLEESLSLETDNEVEWKYNSVDIFDKIVNRMYKIVAEYIIENFGNRKNTSFSSGNFSVSTFITAGLSALESKGSSKRKKPLVVITTQVIDFVYFRRRSRV